MNGKVGYISVAIKANGSPGEVDVPGSGKYVAWSKDPCPVGAEVIVTAERSTRAVTVSPTGL
jgi:hypothetical protein